ncbi:MAG: response regulator [Bacteroidia bacterium]|nr:response regulator [Bacteroidia bacterium]
MKTKLKSILLIDDDEPTNFLHKLVIERLDCAEEIIVHQEAARALEFLKTPRNGTFAQPDLIFLDINMPAMNGWEFLDAYHQLPGEQRGKVVVVMLTTSLNPDDQTRAATIHDIRGFLSKPLSMELMKEVLRKYFGIEE